MNDICEGCKKPISACPYGGDCLEVQAILRAEQKEKLRDIDLSELTEECMSCGCPIEPRYYLCYSCQYGVGRRL